VISYIPAENDKKIPGEKIAFPFFSPRIPVVVKPQKGSPAEKGGIKANDIILSINGEKLRDAGQFMDVVNRSKGVPMTVTVLRGGKIIELRDICAQKSETELPIYRIGIQYSRDVPPKVSELLPDSPAKIAGLQVGDLILEVNGKKIDSPDMLFNEIQESKGKSITLTIEREKSIIKIEDIKTELYNFYDLGVMFAYYQYPSPVALFAKTIDMTYKTLRGILSKKGKLKARNLSGPIGIVHNVGKIVYTGNIIAAIYFLAFISYSLAIFNLLPVPVLDGGHIMIAVIESFLGRPLPEKMLKPVYTAIAVLLIGLMLFVTYYDVLRVIRDLK
jgi:regulator of sigma E protease